MSEAALAELVTTEAPPADAAPQAEASPPADVQAWPSAVLWKVETQLQGGAAGELLVALRLPPPDPEFMRQLFATRSEVTAPLPAAREAALASDEHARAVRLAADLAAAKSGAREAGLRAKHALASARQALAQSADPTPHEEAYRRAKADGEIQANRAQALEQLAGEARAAAAQRLAKDVEAARRRLHAAALAEAERLRRAFVEGAAGLLQPLLAAGWRSEWFRQDVTRGLAELPDRAPEEATTDGQGERRGPAGPPAGGD
jgi:hypothetical protein